MKKRVGRTIDMKYNCPPSVPPPEALYELDFTRRGRGGANLCVCFVSALLGCLVQVGANLGGFGAF